MGSFNRFDPSQNTQKISPLAISTITITLTYNLFLFHILQPTISNGPQTFKFHTETNNGIAYGKTGFAFLNFSVSSIVLALLSTVSVSRPLCLASFILACCSSLSFFALCLSLSFWTFSPIRFFFFNFQNGIFLCLSAYHVYYVRVFECCFTRNNFGYVLCDESEYLSTFVFYNIRHMQIACIGRVSFSELFMD